MPNRTVTGTLFPDQPLSLPIPVLDEPTRQALGETQMQLVDVNLGNRAGLDYTLDYWNAMYEMRTRPRDYPWPNASNYCLPVVQSAVNEFTSRISGSVLTPRPITLRGNDPVSSQYAHLVEQFLNGEYDKHRWREPANNCIKLSARDGTSIMEVMWDMRSHTEFRLDKDPQTGKTIRRPVSVVDYDAPRWQEVELRDFLLCPVYAPSIDAAQGVLRKKYMSEMDCRRMIDAGIFYEDAVEASLQQVQTGMDELPRDRQGARTYTISGRISIAETGVAAPEGVGMMRGPIEVWCGLWRIFDLDNDGVAEDNFIWTADQGRRLLGVAPFQYWRGWPYFPLGLIKRPNRFYHFSVPELVRFAQEEGNAQHNGRLDMLDYALSPMRYRTNSVRFADEDKRWGMDSEVIVQQKGDFGFVDPPQVPQQSQIEESALFQLADRAVGSPQAAAQGVPSGGRQSAKAAQAQQAILAMQSNSVIADTRAWLLDIVTYTLGLYIQYGDDQMNAVVPSSGGQQTVPVPKEILGLNYTVGITGAGGPFDKEQRKQDALMLAQFLSQSPLVQGNLPRVWQLSRMVLETHDIPEVTSYIGTMQESMQQAQQMAAAQAEQQKTQMLMQVLAHSAFGKPQPGKGQQQAPPQPQGPPQPMPLPDPSGGDAQ